MQNKKANTRQVIINAGQECLVKYGYARTTFVKIARTAGISRALLYLYFRNKRDLFATINDERINRYHSASQEVLKSGLSKKEKIEKIVNIWMIDPYRVIARSPNPNAWLDELKTAAGSELHFREYFIKALIPVLGKDLAEVVVFAYRGLFDDRPSVKTLEKRSRMFLDLVAEAEKARNEK
jgi:TetR/AcrR family transcriptional regulator, transcriptional repressor of aconitase